MDIPSSVAIIIHFVSFCVTTVLSSKYLQLTYIVDGWLEFGQGFEGDEEEEEGDGD